MKKLLALLLFAATYAHAQPALVSSVAALTGATSAAINTTGASVIYIVTGSNYRTPTDNMGNVYRVFYSPALTGYAQNFIWAAYNPITSTTHTFQSNDSGIALIAAAFSGVASGPDQTTNATGGNATISVGPLTPTKGYELVISTLVGQFAAGTTFSNNQTMAQSGVQTGGGPNLGMALSYSVQPATAAATTVNWSESNAANGEVAALFSAYSVLAPGPMSITVPNPIPEGVVGAAFSYCPVIQGGTTPYTVTLTGTLQTGLTEASATGCITGTPSGTSSAVPLSFSVSDSESTPQTATASTHLTTVATALSISTTSCPNAKQLTTYVGCTIVATGGSGGNVYSFAGPEQNSYSSIPEGMFLNTSTGAITSTGDVVRGQGGYTALAQVADVGGGKATSPVIFAVAGDNTFGGVQLFPNDSIYHLDVTNLPLDTSAAWGTMTSSYAGVGLRPLFGSYQYGNGGIPINTVSPTQPYLTATAETLANGSVGYVETATVPAPCDAAIEGTWAGVPYPVLDTTNSYKGDNHILTVVTGTSPKLYEMYQAYPNNAYTNGALGCTFFGVQAGEAQFDITSHTYGRANGQPATDAAGMSLAATLLNYDEVAGPCAAQGIGHECGSVNHPIRFTMANTLNYHLWPATLQSGLGRGTLSGGFVDSSGDYLVSQMNPSTLCNGSTCVPGANYNPMGEWFRLPLTVPEPAACSAYPQTDIIFHAMQHHGIINADNGSTGYLVGTNDSRWLDNTTLSNCLNQIKLGQFVAVNVQSRAVNWPNSYQVTADPKIQGPIKLQSVRIQ